MKFWQNSCASFWLAANLESRGTQFFLFGPMLGALIGDGQVFWGKYLAGCTPSDEFVGQ
jgi:hypothetical protein